MAVNLDLYRIFLAVADTGSFSRGAAQLYITQPAVSQSIATLEAQVGTQLFVRSSKGVALTKEGEILQQHAEKALKMLQSGEDKLQEIKQLKAGSLRIGAGDTIAKQFLLPYIQQFHNLYPEVSISVTNRTSLQLMGLLQGGELDFAVVNLPLKQEGITCIPCLQVRDIFVAGQGFMGLKNKTLSTAELAALPLVMLEKQANSRMYVQNFFLQHGTQLYPEIELGAYDLLQEFAKIGLGVACVINQFSQNILQSGELFEIKLNPPIPPRQIGVCFLQDITLTPAAKKFISLITDKG